MEYIVDVKFVFEGKVSVIAENKEEAIKDIEQNLGLCMGGNVHTTSSNIFNWNFDICPDKIIKKCKKNG